MLAAAVSMYMPRVPGTAGGAVSVLGDGTFGAYWYNYVFADTTAKWIWNTDGAAYGAPVNTVPIKFSGEYYATAATAVTIHMIVDDVGKVLLNGNSVGTVIGGWYTGSNYAKLSANLVAGKNVLEVDATNGDGPAGFIAAVYGPGSTLLFHTDASWIWQ